MFRVQEILKRACHSSNKLTKLTSEDLKKLQEHLFGMYKDLEAVCVRHGLQISLAYGNVLGAIRHGGWIPWDDDLDVVMPREDYELLASKYIDELPPKYAFYANGSKKGPITRFPKIVDTSTIFESVLDLAPKHHEGVFIDIFILDNVPTNKLKHRIKNIVAKGLMFIANCVNQKENLTEDYKLLIMSSKEGRKAFRFRSVIGNLFGFIPLNKWFLWIDKIIQNDHKSGKLYCGQDSVNWLPIDEDIIFPAKQFVFPNGQTALIPNLSEEFLTIAYGNWHEIPQDNEKWQHFVKQFKVG